MQPQQPQKPSLEMRGVRCDHCGWEQAGASPWRWLYRACPDCRKRSIVNTLDILFYCLILVIYYVSVIAFKVFGKSANGEMSVDTAPMRQGQVPDMQVKIHYDCPEKLERAVKK